MEKSGARRGDVNFRLFGGQFLRKQRNQTQRNQGRKRLKKRGKVRGGEGPDKREKKRWGGTRAEGLLQLVRRGGVHKREGIPRRDEILRGERESEKKRGSLNEAA